MNKGIVLDIDHFAVHDGPGIRTSIYLKGCPLHCKWCHSPESQEIKTQILFARSRCISCGMCEQICVNHAQNLENGERIFDREKCINCGNCTLHCPTGALFVSGKEMTVDEVKREVLPDIVFFKNSNGGVTLSGGECLMQAEFVYELLYNFSKEGIHTIVETSGYGKKEDLLSLAEYTDIFYYDFKLGDATLFKEYTGGELKVVLDNLSALRSKTERITLRVPLIPDITDTMENVRMAYRTAVQMNISEIHLLPYNQSADAKYEWCGRNYELGKLKQSRELYERLLKMTPAGVHVEIMR